MPSAVKNGIENFVDMSEEEIQGIMVKIAEENPSGMSEGDYLKSREQEFSGLAWDFLTSLAEYNPDLLDQVLENYRTMCRGHGKDDIIREKLKEKYVIDLMLRRRAQDIISYDER